MAASFTHWKHWLLLLGYPLVGLFFLICEALVPRVVHVMEWPEVDKLIPFVPWMVVPYVFWYLSIFFTFGWTGWHNPKEFQKFCTFLYGAMASTCVFYLLYPNGQQLRPPLSSLGSGWDYDTLRWIYGHDTPTNSNPSIHVINAIGVWVALSRDKLLGARPWFYVLLALMSLSIIASTVLIKQHSLLDVFGGLAWAGVWYLVVYFRRPSAVTL